MLILTLLTALLSFLACGLVVRKGLGLPAPYPPDKPQRFHAGHTPRLGGLVMALVFFAVGGVWTWLDLSPPAGGHTDFEIDVAWWLGLALACTPVWLSGLLEDLTQAVSPRWRLLAGGASAVLAIVVLQLTVERVDIGVIDRWLSLHPWGGIAIAALALSAMPHAINLIDGYNGLASTIVMMVAAALAYVAVKVGDWQLLAVIVTLIGATLGFWLWNYPKGLIFAGDGGAYFWGLVLAVISLALVQRNDQVSPWFPVVLLAYPTIETVFSVYRKWIRGQSPTIADALHLHQLIYRRLVRSVFDDDHVRRLLIRNNRTAPYLWGVALMAILPATLFWSQTAYLLVAYLAFVLIYLGAYMLLIRFKVPRWLKR